MPRVEMSTTAQVVLMAEYNSWMNGKVYAAASTLPAADVAAPRGAFFGSILGTLNHLVVADTIWLRRFATHPTKKASHDAIATLPVPSALDEITFFDLVALGEHRQKLDSIVTQWASEVTDDDLASSLHYANMKGVKAQRPLWSLVSHFFNHQTHHRGQVTTLLSQAGADVGATDLVLVIPDELATGASS